jgi:hypothetical protein
MQKDIAARRALTATTLELLIAVASRELVARLEQKSPSITASQILQERRHNRAFYRRMKALREQRVNL